MNINEELLEACRTGKLNKVKELIAAGADIYAVGVSVRMLPLHIAAYNGFNSVVEYLLQLMPVNYTSPKVGNKTALHYAATRGNVDTINLLMENGANQELKDSNNYTPIELAASQHNLNSIKSLISWGADACAPKYFKGTTLLAAACGDLSSNSHIVKYLILEHDCLIPLRYMFDYTITLILMQKQQRDTPPQAILDYFLQHKNNYTEEDKQIFKSRFLKLSFTGSDDMLIKPIIKFL